MKNTKQAPSWIKKVSIPVIIFAISAYFIPWGILFTWLTPVHDTVEEEVEGIINHKLDGALVYVDHGGQTASYASGWFDRKTQIEAQPDDLFKIASISKLYVASAVTKLVADDQLALDDTLVDLLPRVEGRIEYAETITLGHLISHRSGIPNYVDHPDFPWTDLPTKNAQYEQWVFDQPADFQPDDKYAYSNSNYYLLGEILDRTLGYNHHRYIEKEILVPLGLEDTYMRMDLAPVDHLVSGYDMGYDFDFKVRDFIGTGGSMVATAEDVGRFMRAMIDGSLFTEEEQEIYSSVYSYGHTGLLPGYSSITHFHEDIDAVVVLLINTSGGDSWSRVEILYGNIVEILKKQSP